MGWQQKQEFWFYPAPVAQLDRVPGYEPGGREFESLRAHHLRQKSQQASLAGFFVGRHLATGRMATRGRPLALATAVVDRQLPA